MARVCDICSKGVKFGNRVSHSNRKTRRVWEPNLKKVRAMQGSTVTSVKVCTRCLRDGKVVRPLNRQKPA